MSKEVESNDLILLDGQKKLTEDRRDESKPIDSANPTCDPLVKHEIEEGAVVQPEPYVSHGHTGVYHIASGIASLSTILFIASDEPR